VPSIIRRVPPYFGKEADVELVGVGAVVGVGVAVGVGVGVAVGVGVGIAVGVAVAVGVGVASSGPPQALHRGNPTSIITRKNMIIKLFLTIAPPYFVCDFIRTVNYSLFMKITRLLSSNFYFYMLP
jgi:hypothetical protein